ncbi:MAG: type II toxin-antitoxin system VapC family toxin [Nocardioides sp.]
MHDACITVLGHKLTPPRASDALTDYLRLPIVRYPAEPLLPRVWELRGRFTAYDATFVALAQALDCRLVTCDRRLRATGVRIERF